MDSSKRSRQILIIHIAFMAACAVYALVGALLKASIELEPLLPAKFAMVALAPGVLCALAGIVYYRKAAQAEGQQRITYYMTADGLVEALAITAFVIFFLSGGEVWPLYSGCGMAIFVMLLNFPGKG